MTDTDKKLTLTTQIAHIEQGQNQRRLANALAQIRSSVDEIERSTARGTYSIAGGTVRNIGQHVGDATEAIGKLALIKELGLT